MDIKELSEKLKKDFAYSYDFITVEGKIGEKDALYFYLDGMIDKQLLEYSVIRSLKEWKGDSFTAEEIGKATFSSATVSEVEDYDKCKAQAVLGFVCFYLE
ncbi:MAG: spore germination protein [Clostridia bacterium]|nr:spore germination protein [Clostridia bacterium]